MSGLELRGLTDRQFILTVHSGVAFDRHDEAMDAGQRLARLTRQRIEVRRRGPLRVWYLMVREPGWERWTGQTAGRSFR